MSSSANYLRTKPHGRRQGPFQTATGCGAPKYRRRKDAGRAGIGKFPSIARVLGAAGCVRAFAPTKSLPTALHLPTRQRYAPGRLDEGEIASLRRMDAPSRADSV